MWLKPMYSGMCMSLLPAMYSSLTLFILHSKFSTLLCSVCLLVSFLIMHVAVFVLGFSTILKGGTIWWDSSRPYRKQGSMLTFALGLMFVLSGILGTPSLSFFLLDLTTLALVLHLRIFTFSFFFFDTNFLTFLTLWLLGGFPFGWSMFRASASERTMSLSRLIFLTVSS